MFNELWKDYFGGMWEVIKINHRLMGRFLLNLEESKTLRVVKILTGQLCDQISQQWWAYEYITLKLRESLFNTRRQLKIGKILNNSKGKKGELIDTNRLKFMDDIKDEWIRILT